VRFVGVCVLEYSASIEALQCAGTRDSSARHSAFSER